MSDQPAYVFQPWPSWRFGPGGASGIFECEADVPIGWVNNPNDVKETDDGIREEDEAGNQADARAEAEGRQEEVRGPRGRPRKADAFNPKDF